MKRLDASQLSDQEKYSRQEFEKFYGKNRNGFSDFSMEGIDCIILGMYLRNPESLDSNGKYPNLKSAARSLGYYRYDRVFYTFKAAYNLASDGYYPEASTLLRTILETFTRHIFVERHGKVEDVTLALAGHHGKDGKKFAYKYKEQFDKLSPGLYSYYQGLCDIAHGALASFVLRTYDNFQADTGVFFRDMKSSFVTNQFATLLYAHLKHLVKLFPEIREKNDQEFETKFRKAMERLQTLHQEIVSAGKNDKWMKAMDGLLSP